MRDSRLLVTRLRSTAEKLKRAAMWRGSLEPVDSAKDDYLYELLCYFHVALSVKATYSIAVVGKLEVDRKGQRFAKWPRKSGHMKNFSYISLKKLGASVEVFQLCPGIRVIDKHGKDRAPDVNLLKGGTPNQPTHRDLVGCWDAKYVSDEASRLADTAVSDFVHTYQQLGNPVPPTSWIAATTDNAFRQPGLLTNGRESSEREAALKENGISETSGFPNNPKTRP